MKAVIVLLVPLLLPLVSAQTFRWGPCPTPMVQPNFELNKVGLYFKEEIQNCHYWLTLAHLSIVYSLLYFFYCFWSAVSVLKCALEINWTWIRTWTHLSKSKCCYFVWFGKAWGWKNNERFVTFGVSKPLIMYSALIWALPFTPSTLESGMRSKSSRHPLRKASALRQTTRWGLITPSKLSMFRHSE